MSRFFAVRSALHHKVVLVLFSLVFISLMTAALAAEKAVSKQVSYGYSPIHPLKYKSGFKHFDYVNPNAPKFGTLKIGAIGTFSSLNTLKWPGVTPRLGSQGIGLRGMLYDSLLVASADEVAGYYGLLAEKIEVADDLSQVRFSINQQAKWHDGKPVTAQDVKFTFETLAKQGVPFYRQVLRGMTLVVENRYTIVIKAGRPGNRDFVSLVGSIPIHPQHFWMNARLNKANLNIPLGSGPYQVAMVKAGEKLVLQRAENYWAVSHPVNKGRFNFETIAITFFLDNNVALESFRVGDANLRFEHNATRWKTGYGGEDLTSGKIKRLTIGSKKVGQINGLVFNLREKKFSDVRVRRAISLAYDFNWTNDNLFYGSYRNVESFFGDTYLAARGKISPQEKQLLGRSIKELPQLALIKPGPKTRAQFGSEREALKRAGELLDEAGFKLVGKNRIDPHSGGPFRIEVIFADPQLERPLAVFAKALKRLGIALEYRARDSASSHKRLLDHSFDMAAMQRWSPGLLPGIGERLLWGSRLADKKGSYALAGVKSNAMDTVLEAMNKAKTIAQLTVAGMAFDRLMRWGQYMLPLWRVNESWVAWHGNFARPNNPAGLNPGVVDIWWLEKDK